MSLKLPLALPHLPFNYQRLFYFHLRKNRVLFERRTEFCIIFVDQTPSKNMNALFFALARWYIRSHFFGVQDGSLG